MLCAFYPITYTKKHVDNEYQSASIIQRVTREAIVLRREHLESQRIVNMDT